ncbi:MULTISPECIES: hypothetical protein [Flavobacterium]|uniref:Lipoprotein n=1 Tax=Flavobacterium jumunjinense TaxID=998845 RepID=A0ABV5GSN1_9FLAO|nr:MULTISPECIES: hypothetical protein [Flavobacterium]
MKLLKTLLAMLLLLFVSCAVKHKEKQHEKVAVQLKSTTHTKSTALKETLATKALATKKEVEFEVSNVSYQGNKGDSLVITETNLNTGVTTKKTYQGSGTFTQTKTKGSTSENIKSTTRNQASQNKAAENQNHLDAKIQRSKSKKLVDKQSFFNWWLLLLLVVIAIAWYLNKEFNWVFKLYSQIMKVASLIFK